MGEALYRFRVSCLAGNFTDARALLPQVEDHLNSAACNPLGQTIMCEAIARGNFAAVRFLLGLPCLDPNRRSCPAEAMQLLLGLPGVDPNRTDFADLLVEEETPLILAAGSSADPLILPLLLQDPRVMCNLVAHDGSALHRAVLKSLPGNVRLLLEDPRVDPRLKQQSLGCSALLLANSFNRVNIVRLLLGRWTAVEEVDTVQAQQRDLPFSLCRPLLQRYARNPAKTRRQLRQEIRWTSRAARLLVLTCLIRDHFLAPTTTLLLLQTRC